VIRAPRERVFASFSSIAEMKRWFGPGDCHVTGGEMDFRVGGTYRLNMHTSDFGPADLTGTFLEIVANERIVYTWNWRNNPTMASWNSERVTIQFADEADGTRLTIQHDGFETDEVRSSHEFGWNGCCDKLSAYLEGAK
jgi:uncharacterized protein YndB with AHSA1/START domain